LDYDKTSDLEDVAGHWHVESAASHAADKARPCSRVFYACDVQMKGVVPAPLMNYMSKTALRQATAWVKKESEAHPDLTVSSSYGGNMLPVSPAVATAKPSTASVAAAGGATDTGRRRLWGLI
jgi:hypothetical protein